MLRKSWMMARIEMRMVFKSRNVQYIPVMIVLMSVIMAIIIAFFIFSFPIPDAFYFNIMMSSTMGIVIIMMPVMLPVMIAADSIVGEKERNTLVPLLATPLTDSELIIGKLLTALVPGIIVAYANFALSIAIVNVMALFIAPIFLWVWPLAQPVALVQAIVMPPLFAILAVWVMVIISGHVSKVYEAYQWGGIIIIPSMLFSFSPILSGTGFDWMIFFFGAGILCIIDYGLYRLTLNLFNRDKLISRH